MDWVTIATIISTFGGLEFLKWFFSRKNINRKANADIREQELSTHEKQIDRYEQRLSLRDAKVDAIYKELRDEQSQKLILLEENNRLKLEKELLAHQKCEVRGCSSRKPPGIY